MSSNTIRAALMRLAKAAERMAGVDPIEALDMAAALADLDASLAAPPAPEPGELVAELRDAAFDLNGSDPAKSMLTRAADLLEQYQGSVKSAPSLTIAAAPAVVPIPVSERLPEANTKVLAHYFNDLGNGRTVCAIWVPAKSRSDDADFAYDDFTEYDEETDKFYWPEGWYEAIENWDDLGWVKVDEGEVVYWQPLPKWPARAIPLLAPQSEEGEG